MYFDSGPGNDRIIILTTNSNLDLMRQSERWCGDGTFKAAPKLWTQLYTIHGLKNGYTVPCVFALLPNKRKESYTRLFRQIKSWLDVAGQQWNFESFLSDYEQGAYLAMTDVFPGVGNDGCFFHLSKRLDYHVKQLGLTVKYTNNVAFRIRVKCLAALAFLPVTDVILAFESLAITFLNDELPLLSYFETTWIGQPAGGRRLAPTFPHQMWNVLDRASTGWVHQDYELTRGVSSHLQRTRILPTPYRVEATPSTGKTAEPHRRHPHPNTTRGFLPYECK